MRTATGSELRVITNHGEIVGEVCASCVTYQEDLTKLRAKVRRLEHDPEEKARQHKLWDEAAALHDWWALATGHEGTAFEAEEFWQASPRLKKHKPVEILKAIAGLAFDPNTKQTKNGSTERYDSWKLLMSKNGFERYQGRAPYPAKEHQWKLWLVHRIESRFR